MSAPESARSRLMAASNAIGGAVVLIRLELPTIEAFIKECSDMDSFGPIVDPTLYRDPERRACAALLLPAFKSAVQFLRAYDLLKEAAAATLEKVEA